MSDNTRPRRSGPGRPPIYPWRDIEIGESFSIPDRPGAPSLRSIRHMACQAGRRAGRKFRVSPTPDRGRWIITRIAMPSPA